MTSPLIGISGSINQIREQIKLVADTNLHVVITGETGSGKDVVARNLYHESSRHNKPFIKINCAALPMGLLESELFGYERGAFTGADRRLKGKFELADKGVLFLDEICEMPLALQAKLLHVLQSGEFTPLGSEISKKTDAWIISATNRLIADEVNNNNFRKDLYYRLNIINIQIPPLRNRPEDIMILIDYFIDQYSGLAKGKFTIPKPNVPQTEALVSYPWPGNVRQIQNVIRRMIVRGNWDSIISELRNDNLAKEISQENRTSSPKISMTPDILDFMEVDLENSASISLKKITKNVKNKVEKEIIYRVLSETGWNRRRAARILKISYRALLYKIVELNIMPKAEYDLNYLYDQKN